jgi:ferredoxin
MAMSQADPAAQAVLFIGTVAPSGQQFDAFSNFTLLQSMEAGFVDWPSSCRNGTCRTCIGQLRRGAVRYEIDWPGLSAEEKAAGYVLPCVAYPVCDVELQR